MSSILCCEIFLIFEIRAADIGMVFENKERSRVPAAERTTEGRKRDMVWEDARLSSYIFDVSNNPDLW